MDENINLGSVYNANKAVQLLTFSDFKHIFQRCKAMPLNRETNAASHFHGQENLSRLVKRTVGKCQTNIACAIIHTYVDRFQNAAKPNRSTNNYHQRIL